MQFTVRLRSSERGYEARCDEIPQANRGARTRAEAVRAILSAIHSEVDVRDAPKRRSV